MGIDSRWQPFVDNWGGFRVLVTGSSGFLGRRMIYLLHKLGAEIAGIDIMPPPIYLNAYATLHLGDVRDYETVERILVSWKPDVLFHLAAITQVVDAREMPLQTYDTNIMGTANVLEAVRRNFPGRVAVVVASSDKAYGDYWAESANQYVSELAHSLATHPYDVSKAAADDIAASYSLVYNESVCATRCGNIYGPGDQNWQRLIPATILAAFTGETLIVRSDGELVREYNYIDDVIEAYLLVAQHALAGGHGVWNVSDPAGRLSVIEAIERVRDALGVDINYEIANTALNESLGIALDSSLIREQLGWQPRIPLRDGIIGTVDWMQRFQGLGSDRRG